MDSDRPKGRYPIWVLIAPLMLVGVMSARWIGALMPACYFHEWTGLFCPGCGATRAAVALGQGRFLEAVGYNVLFVMVITVGGLWVILGASRLKYPEVKWLKPFQWRLYFLWLALGVLIAFGCVRNLPGLEWLGPR